MQTQQHLLQQLLRVQRTRFVLGQLLLHEAVQIRKNGIVLRRKLAQFRLLRNAPTGIQFGQHDLYVLIPAPHFQHIDALFSGHQVDEAPT